MNNDYKFLEKVPTIELLLWLQAFDSEESRLNNSEATIEAITEELAMRWYKLSEV